MRYLYLTIIATFSLYLQGKDANIQPQLTYESGKKIDDPEIKFSDDGNYFYLKNYEQIKIYDAHNGLLLKKINGNAANQISLSPNFEYYSIVKKHIK